MNKRLIAFALVLLIAVGGVFAALPDLDSSDDVTATLKAVLGPYFDHGFTNPVTLSDYQTGVVIGDGEDDDAFEVITPLTYKYKTNITGAFKITMDVSDFMGSGQNVKIEKVVLGNDVATPVEGVYTLFNISGGAGKKTGSTQISIYPVMTVTGKDHLGVTIEEGSSVNSVSTGTYTSTITISVSGS